MAAVGLPVECDDGDMVVATIPNGHIRHRTAREVADRRLTGEVYIAGGVFRPGSIVGESGRKAENVERVYWLQCDADLIDWLGDTWTKEEMYALPDAQLRQLIDLQLEDLHEAFGAVGLRPQRIDYTGYGLCAYLYINRASQGDVARLRGIHKRLVERINDVAHVPHLLDPQVSDAGTRITRLPGSLNLKGSIPRTVETLEYIEDDYRIEQLEAALGVPAPPVRLVPRTGKGLDENTVELIVSHLSEHWAEGQRHVLALGLSGMLAKAGVPQEQALSIIQQVSAGDGEAWDRARAVQTSYERYASGLATRGFYALKDYLPPDFVLWLDGELDKIRPITSGVTMKLHVASETEAPKLSLVPECAYHGWYGQYRDLVEPTTEAADVFHLGAALAMVSATVGRRISSSYSGDPLYPSLYVALIGPSGSSRKDTAIKRALHLSQVRAAVGGGFHVPGFHIARDVSSGEGLIQTLKDHPTTLLYLSELSVLLKNARKKGTTTILDRLIEAWDVPHRLENLSKLAKNEAENPFLSIIAATQPERIAAEILPEDIHSGFANRWLFLPGTGKGARPNPPAVDDHEAEALQYALSAAIASYPVGYVLHLSDEADRLWDDWYMAFYAEQARADDDVATMRIRLPVLIQKVAMLYAITDKARRIEVEHLSAATALIEWSWRHVNVMMKEWGIGLFVQIERKIEDVLMRRGPVKKRVLAQQCKNRKWGARDFNQVLMAMRDTGQIVIGPDGVVGFPADDES